MEQVTGDGRVLAEEQVPIRLFLGPVIGLLCVYVLFNVVFVRDMVVGSSMEPGYRQGDLVMALRHGAVRVGSIVVLHDPGKSGQSFIKRVIGVPGDEVRLAAGVVYVNGQVVEEPYVVEPCRGDGCDGQWQLGRDEYFVMGDNRNHSMDSRTFGPIRSDLLEGVVVLRYWPLSKLG